MNRDDLYRIWKAERSSKTLQVVPSSFYSEASRLLKEATSSSTATAQDATQGALFEKEVKILQRLTTEIAETRMKKIVEASLCRQVVPLEMLTKEEGEFARKVTSQIANQYSYIDNLGRQDLASQKPTVAGPGRTGLQVVRFLSDFPAIIGVDLKTYGPFKAEDIAALPTENVTALVNQGVVKQVRIPEQVASAVDPDSAT
jgi:DNA replication factor GINS